MKKIVSIFFIWVLLLNAFAVLVNNRISLKGDNAYSWQNPEAYAQTQTWNTLGLHSQWDSAYYLYIAEHGYQYTGEGLANIAFFPLYPMLIRVLAPLCFFNYALCGWLISLASLLAALVFLKKLIDEFHPGISSTLAATFLLIFPTAFFLNVIYTEALFLFLGIAAFYWARRGNFFLAGLIALAAALTRPPGFLLFLPLLMEFIVAKRKRAIFLVSLLLPLLGPLIYFSFHALWYGNFFAFFTVEDAWGRAFVFNASHFEILSRAGWVNIGMDIFFLLSGMVSALFVAGKVRLSYGIYMLAMILLALGTGTLLSIGRFVLVLFPMYLLFSRFQNTYLKLGIAFASILLLAFYTLLFVNGYWAG